MINPKINSHQNLKEDNQEKGTQKGFKDTY